MVATVSPLVGQDSSVEHTLACTLQGNDILVDYLATELVAIGAGSEAAVVILNVIGRSIGSSVIRVMPSDLGRLASLDDQEAMTRLKSHLYDRHPDFGRAFMQCLLALKMCGPADQIAAGIEEPEDARVSAYRPLLDIFTVAYALLAGCSFDARSND